MKIKIINSEMYDFETFSIGFYRTKNNQTFPCFYPKQDMKFDSMERYSGEFVFEPIPLDLFNFWLSKYNEFGKKLIDLENQSEPEKTIRLERVWLEANLAVNKFSSQDVILSKLGIGLHSAQNKEKRSVYGYAIVAYFITNNVSYKDTDSCRTLAAQLGYSVSEGEDYCRQLRLCVDRFTKYLEAEVKKLNVPLQDKEYLYEWLVFKLFSEKRQALINTDLSEVFISALDNAHLELNKVVLQFLFQNKDQN